MKYTKSEYKKKIAKMKFSDLVNEKSKLKKIIMLAKMETTREQNPTARETKNSLDAKAKQLGLDNFSSMQITKWKHAVVSQRLHDLTIKQVRA